MFTSERPYIFHVELTDKCNAGCPMCPRTDAMNFCKPDRTKVFNVELGLEDFRTHFTDEFCARTEEIVFGGAYGDPLAASQLLEIVEHLTERGVRLAVSTNGGLRPPKWWTRLGEAMKRTGSRLELHLDGLADTNHLYRVNTRWERIMENARAYIATGARAEWHFIIFKHNQHQIEEANRLSKEMGFAEFTLIDTIRFSGGPTYDYVMPTGERCALELPDVKAAQFRASDDGGVALLEKPAAATDGPRLGVNGIDCKSAAFNRPYISAHGQVSACCWVTGSDEEAAFFADHGLGPERYNIRNRPLEDILLDEPFASLYARAWAQDSLKNCRHKCGRMLRNKRNTLWSA
ncbi:radical SAM protein [Limibaculum sp. M0105]|uniref:Radical SAM protein n=1 Tax=Thermohalobaculum xanthum TaxID=2753746 RepID=A0A8J7M3H0_9RHOB|nr:radical SAM protein [Thermohalobaculum xanthum]MBK0397611.1 radical SAM protein [Thermohalobaculum xanthum]